MSSPSDPIQDRIKAANAARRYDSNLDVQTCLAFQPQVGCRNNTDCTQWIQTNCAEHDTATIVSQCGTKGMCIFQPLTQ